MRVIADLVLNHTSDQHPWFQAARLAPPGSSKRDFYVWSQTVKKWPETRIIFTDTEISNWTWDPVAGSHYWHRFFSHQPDLNFDSPDVREAVLNRSAEIGIAAHDDGAQRVRHQPREAGGADHHLPRLCRA